VDGERWKVEGRRWKVEGVGSKEKGSEVELKFCQLSVFAPPAVRQAQAPKQVEGSSSKGAFRLPALKICHLI